MSNSPRTDDFIDRTLTRHVIEKRDDFEHYMDMSGVLAEFARQFERELALKDHDLLLERDRAEKAEQAFNEWENKAGQYREERDKAEKELETERMRLAGCSAAALGYFYGCSEEYKSASLSDVLALRERYDKAVSAYKEVSEQKLKAEAQIKMLVEALEEPMKHIRNMMKHIRNIKKTADGSPGRWNALNINEDELIKLREAIAEFKKC